MAQPSHVDFRLRTVAFSRRVLVFCATSQAGVHGPHIREQLRKAGTSIAANVEEAKAAHSKRDFLARMTIALREARETLYWLRLLRTDASDTADPACDELGAMTDEADQLVAILTVTVRTTRARLKEEEEARARRRR